MNTIRKISEILPEVNIEPYREEELQQTSQLKIIKVHGTVNCQKPPSNNEIIIKHANSLIENYQINKPLFTNLKRYFLGMDGEFNPKKGLFLFGGVGAGKTSIMKIFRFIKEKFRCCIAAVMRKPLHRSFIIAENGSEVMTMQAFNYADGTRRAIEIWEPKSRYFIYG